MVLIMLDNSLLKLQYKENPPCNAIQSKRDASSKIWETHSNVAAKCDLFTYLIQWVV